MVDTVDVSSLSNSRHISERLCNQLQAELRKVMVARDGNLLRALVLGVVPAHWLVARRPLGSIPERDLSALNPTTDRLLVGVIRVCSWAISLPNSQGSQGELTDHTRAGGLTTPGINSTSRRLQKCWFWQGRKMKS